MMAGIVTGFFADLEDDLEDWSLEYMLLEAESFARWEDGK